MTTTTRYVYDENGLETINGLPATIVTDTWDGEIDADGLYIEDAYNLEDILITGNDSEKLLSLLAQIINIKSLQRGSKFEFNVQDANGTQIVATSVNRTIGDATITKCYKSTSTVIIPSGCVKMQMTYLLITDNADLFPEVSGVLINTTPVPYADYQQYIDYGLNVVFPVDRIAYYDQNNNIHMTNEKIDQFGTTKSPAMFNMYVMLDKNNLNNGAIVAEVNTAIDTTNYTYYNRVYSRGLSQIPTTYKLTNTSSALADILFTNDYSAEWRRIIGAGIRTTSEAMTSNFQDGYLHVSYIGDTTDWTLYQNVTMDYGVHEYCFSLNGFYIDGNLIGSKSNSTSFTTPKVFTILGDSADNVDRTKMHNSAYIYFAAIYQNGVLLAALYPAKNSSDVYGLHDIINDVFYTSDNLALTNA